LNNSKQDDGIYEWQIVDKIQEASDAFTYTFLPTTSQKFQFTVGQFVLLGVPLRRPTPSGGSVENVVERAYSIASSPLREKIELTIKKEKPYGYINPANGTADGFAAYFFEQVKIGDKVKVRLNPRKDHFLWKVASGVEKDVAYWSGSNGAESARCLIQFIEDTKDPDLKLTLFYSNPNFYAKNGENAKDAIRVIYYRWLLEMAKKLPNLKVIFTFTRAGKDQELPTPDDENVVFRRGRFFIDSEGKPEKTLSKYHPHQATKCINPICGSSAFVNGVVRLADGSIIRGKGIMQNLVQAEGVAREKIDIEQYYLESVGAHR
jgi:ferredoxin-NADP reductase